MYILHICVCLFTYPWRECAARASILWWRKPIHKNNKEFSPKVVQSNTGKSAAVSISRLLLASDCRGSQCPPSPLRENLQVTVAGSPGFDGFINSCHLNAPKEVATIFQEVLRCLHLAYWAIANETAGYLLSMAVNNSCELALSRLVNLNVVKKLANGSGDSFLFSVFLGSSSQLSAHGFGIYFSSQWEHCERWVASLETFCLKWSWEGSMVLSQRKREHLFSSTENKIRVKMDPGRLHSSCPPPPLTEPICSLSNGPLADREADSPP